MDARYEIRALGGISGIFFVPFHPFVISITCFHGSDFSMARLVYFS